MELVSWSHIRIVIIIWLSLFVYSNNSVEQSSSWEADSHLDSHEIPRRFLKLKGSLLCLQKSTIGLCPESDESTHHHISLFILVPPSYQRLGLPSGLFLSGYKTKTVYAFLLSPINSVVLVRILLCGCYVCRLISQLACQLCRLG
jgi:hypothetical protein